MNKKLLLLLVPLFATGCSTNTGTGALVGAGGGGLLGAGIGSLAGKTGTGAALGAGLGTIVGAAVGADKDREEQRAKAAATAAAMAPAMTMQDVVFMTHNHQSPEIIINQIQTTNSAFALSAQDVVYLKSQGVHDQVIGFMQARRAGPVAVRPARSVYVIEEPPPVSVGFGVYSGPRYRPYPYRHCW